MDLRPCLRALRRAGRIRSDADAADRTRLALERDGQRRATDYILNMFEGSEPMNPDILAALHRWLGFERRGLDREIWRDPDRVAEAAGPAPTALIDVLGAMERASAPCATLQHDGRMTARIRPRTGPPTLEIGLHRFALRHKGLGEGWVMLLEHVPDEDKWFSLQGTDGATIDGAPLDGGSLRGRDATLTLSIDGPHEICRIVALVSNRPFDPVIFRWAPPAGSTGEPVAVMDRELAAYLSGLDPLEQCVVAASYTYRV